MPGKGKFSREEGFLGGPVFPRKRGSESFWGKCLKRIRVSDNASFSKNRDGRMTVVYILPLSSHGRITVVYIYRRFYPKDT